jgi:hypothetical protein
VLKKLIASFLLLLAITIAAHTQTGIMSNPSDGLSSTKADDIVSLDGQGIPKRVTVGQILDGYISSAGYTTFSAARAAAVEAGKGLLVVNILPLTRTEVATVPIRIAPFGAIRQTGKYELEISSSYQFDGTPGCFIAFLPGQVTGLKEAIPDWWGADTTGSHACVTAIQAANNSLSAGGTLRFSPGGRYKVTGMGIRLSSNVTVEGAGATLIGDGPSTTKYFFTSKGAVMDPNGNGLVADGDATWKSSANRQQNITVKDLIFRGKGKNVLSFANVANLKIQNCYVISDAGSRPDDSIRVFVTLSGAIDGAIIENNDIYAAGGVWIVTSNRDAADYPLSRSDRAFQAVKHVRIMNNKCKLFMGGTDEAFHVGSYGGDTYDVLVSGNQIINDVEQETGVWGIFVGQDPSIPSGRPDDAFIHDISVVGNSYFASISTLNKDAVFAHALDRSTKGFQVYNITISGNKSVGTTTSSIHVGSVENAGVTDNQICSGRSGRAGAWAIKAWNCRRLNISGNIISDYQHATAQSENSGGILVSGKDINVIGNHLYNVRNTNSTHPTTAGIQANAVIGGAIAHNLIDNSALTIGIYSQWSTGSTNLGIENNILNGVETGIALGGIFNSVVKGNVICNSTIAAFNWQNNSTYVAGNLVEGNLLKGNRTVSGAGFPSDSVVLFQNNTVEGYFCPYQATKLLYGTAPPSTGTYGVGDRLVNTRPTVGQPKSWICIVAGSPGTWVSEGNL